MAYIDRIIRKAILVSVNAARHVVTFWPSVRPADPRPAYSRLAALTPNTAGVLALRNDATVQLMETVEEPQPAPAAAPGPQGCE